MQAAGARFIRGRSLDGSDNRFPPTTLVINETFAKRFFGNEDPIGKLLKFGTAESKEPWITVVGVVADLHRQGLEKHAVCEGFGPLINPSMDVIVRGSLPAAALTPGVRSVIRELDPRAPVYGITTLGDRLEQFTADRRMESWLLGGFSSLTLLLAAVGIYGVLQYVVAQRRREIAIRIALGADNRRIFDSVLRRGLAQAALGIIAGLTAALALARVTSSLLYGVSPLDPISYGVSCGVLAAVAAAACWLPARTAARTDPAELLRE